MSTSELLDRIFGDRVYLPLAEVADLTGWSQRSLLDDCRAGVIDHTERRGTRTFTREQVEALLRQYERKGAGEPASAVERVADDFEAARVANAARISAGRRGRAA